MDFVRVGYFIPLNGPLNGHPPSKGYFMRISIISAKVCLQFFSFFKSRFFSHLFYDNINTFIIIKCPAELNFDCKILIWSVPSTFVTGLLSRGYVFYTWPKPTPSRMRSETNNNALSNLSYRAYIHCKWLLTQ